MRALPNNLSLDAVLFSSHLTASERVEMAWQVLRLACEEAGVKAPLNPMAPKLENLLAANIAKFFKDFEFPYDRKIDFIKMVRSTILDYNTAYGEKYASGLREAKAFTDFFFSDQPFTKWSGETTIASYLRLMNFERFFKA